MSNNINHTVDNRQQAREDIEAQIQEFLKKGGEIEVLNSAFDNKDPKCRLGEEMGLFV